MKVGRGRGFQLSYSCLQIIENSLTNPWPVKCHDLITVHSIIHTETDGREKKNGNKDMSFRWRCTGPTAEIAQRKGSWHCSLSEWILFIFDSRYVPAKDTPLTTYACIQVPPQTHTHTHTRKELWNKNHHLCCSSPGFESITSCIPGLMGNCCEGACQEAIESLQSKKERTEG